MDTETALTPERRAAFEEAGRAISLAYLACRAAAPDMVGNGTLGAKCFTALHHMLCNAGPEAGREAANHGMVAPLVDFAYENARREKRQAAKARRALRVLMRM